MYAFESGVALPPVPPLLPDGIMERGFIKSAAVLCLAGLAVYGTMHMPNFSLGKVPHQGPGASTTPAQSEQTPGTVKAQITGLPCESWISNPAKVTAAIAAAKAAAQQSIVASGAAPGGTVAFSCGDKRIASFSVGTTGSNEPISPSTTQYDLASDTKMFTAVAMEMLEDDGKLKMSDKVSKYLPNQFGSGLKANATLLQLGQHEAGFNDPKHATFLGAGKTPNQVLDSILNWPAQYQPGTHYEYSNVGFVSLYAAGSVAAGMPLSTYIQNRIFKPLGMTNTGYQAQAHNCAPTSPDANRAAILTCQDQDSLAAGLGGYTGHAGVFSTADDSSIFDGMLANGGIYKGKRILSLRAITEMKTAHYAANATIPDTSYGFGAHLNSSNGLSKYMSTDAFGHTGFTGPAFLADPVSGMSFVQLNNSTLHKLGNENLGYTINMNIADKTLAVLQSS